MALKHVYQVHGNGCFIAAMAMLLGKTYEEALKILHPGASMDGPIEGLKSDYIGDAASNVLKNQGCKVKKSTYKRIKSVVKYARQNVLLIIRWGGGYMCHAIVYDVETKRFLDPSGSVYEGRLSRYYETQLDSMYYVDLPKAA